MLYAKGFIKIEKKKKIKKPARFVTVGINHR